LAKVWIQLIENAQLRAQIGAAARAIAERNRGATARTLDRIAPFIGDWSKANHQ
jgi:hypothetical protein